MKKILKEHKKLLDEWFISEETNYIILNHFEDKNIEKYAGYVLAIYNNDKQVVEIVNAYILFAFHKEQFKISVDDRTVIPASVNLTVKDSEMLSRLFKVEKEFINGREL